MPEITHHVPGMFSWTELSTTDENAALRFYGSLFGWTDDPQPMGEGATYHMQQVKGLPAAAIYGQMEEERQQGVPPNWRAYFTVASADDTATRVQQAGGRVLAGPFDVFDSGRIIVAQDPQGAVFAAWQPNQHIGAREVRDGETWAVIAVRDQGLGIPAADLPHIFERFQRSRNVAGRISGTRIGLTSARQIVEQRGGTISVESREGVGSTFTARLPPGSAT